MTKPLPLANCDTGLAEELLVWLDGLHLTRHGASYCGVNVAAVFGTWPQATHFDALLTVLEGERRLMMDVEIFTILAVSGDHEVRADLSSRGEFRLRGLRLDRLYVIEVARATETEPIVLTIAELLQWKLSEATITALTTLPAAVLRAMLTEVEAACDAIRQPLIGRINSLRRKPPEGQ